MKKIILVIQMFVIGLTNLKAQTNTEYNRSTITPIMIENDLQKYNSKAKNEFLVVGINVPDKFNNHCINKPFSDKIEPDKSITNKIIAKWFNRKEDGTFDMELIKQRGTYNATDATVMESKSSIRGHGAIEDAGEKLINNSYILVYDYYEIESMPEYYNRMDIITDKNNAQVDAHNKQARDFNRNKKSTEKPMEFQEHESYMVRDKEGYYGTIGVELYQLDWNEQVKKDFYEEMWIQDTNDPDLQTKINKFDNYNFPIKRVTKKQIHKSFFSNQFKDRSRNEAAGNRQLSNEELFRSLIRMAVSEGYSILEGMSIFGVKTSLYATNPFKAKIGLKEGVGVDQRYFVFENYQNSAGKIKTRRKGVVRTASYVADNRQEASGESKGSEFYQVAGGKLDKGMLLQQKNDAGLGFAIANGIQGINLLLEYNTGKFSGVPGLKIFGDVTFLSKNYDTYRSDLASKINVTEQILEDKDFKPTLSTFVVNFSVGLSKDINFMRNFVLIPFAAWGQETVKFTDDNKIIYDDKYLLNSSTKYTYNNNSFKDSTIITYNKINLGCRFGMNLLHNVQVLGTMTYNIKISKKLNDEILHTGNYLPEDIISSESKLYYSLGLRFQF
ncbi:MAG: hypothetical protein ACOYMA_09435 [Bacteroidia bacterium]